MNTSIWDRIDPSALTETEQNIYAYLTAHPRQVCRMSLETLCREIYTSSATVVRFCQKLGFSGYNELKFTLRRELEYDNQDFRAYQNLIDWQLSVSSDSLRNLDTQLLEDICHQLDHTQACYIYGSDSSLMVAHYFHSILTALDYPTILLRGRYLLEAFTYNFDKAENAMVILFTAHASQADYGTIMENLAPCGNRVIWICSEDNHEVPLSDQIFIHTNEANEQYHNVDFNFKFHSLILVQALLEMLCQRKVDPNR